ncbi:WD40 repeat-like protein [Annulohypoxylon maeteangense]|uniref:WD40 repeat-like protein n=1 Tax=Annulohypoxylon maeteangense TaxID=1927788 RepID=UPI0020071FBD|nr:WD40 repeat-like protein [Annulohypoxylon maeteangense]KAI0882426.1 WD40 repeat-like protein [Annulohypoxylon maeteangense]
MAMNAPNTSSRRKEVIDLTSDNDDEESDVVTRDKSSLQLPLKRLGHRSNSINGYHSKVKTNGPSISNTPQHVQPSPSLPSPFSIQAQEHPTKRRKIQHGSSRQPALPSPSPSTDTKALTRCLQNQVFPHLERAVKKLDKNIYDVEKLGGKIIGRVANQQFERHFHDGNGKLAPDIEASVIVQIHGLVAEFIKGNEFRRDLAPPIPPSPSLPPNPVFEPKAPIMTSVIPSIENPVDESPPHYDDEYEGDGGKESSRNGPKPEESTRQQVWTPPRILPKKKPPLSPQQQRTRIKATQWQSGRSYEFKRDRSPAHMENRWFGLLSRPYLPAEERRLITRGVSRGRGYRIGNEQLRQPSVYHVDFSDGEVKYLRYLARSLYGRPARGQRSDSEDLRRLLKKSGADALIARITDVHRHRYTNFQDPPLFLLQRSPDDIKNFLHDLHHKHVDEEKKSLFLERDDANSQFDVARTAAVPSLLLAREIVGNRLGATRRYVNFNTALKSNREDYLEPKVEWTNCAGDIMTIAWTPDSTRFICGTTTHSDSHNQQYNKPGNLLFGSVAENTLQAYPDHRIPRPLVEHGDNSLPSMRESQDPWLYTSVVSSDYDPTTGWLFTSSFDHTVRVWCPSETNKSGVTLRHTWGHEGRVNFVVTNKNKAISKVATAADIPENAVRVYHASLDGETLLGYDYNEFTCKRVHGEDYVPSDKWAYFPSAIRWGVESSVNHLLLVGYSPRSLNGDDNDIPEDKHKTGELCLWDTNTNTEVKVNSAATSNVFEVVWHPSRPSFAVATSASQTSEKIEEHIRTQIRLFELNETGQYGVVKTLDCPAIDINEITIRPNSILYSYLAAGCTDGKVYIWDSARSEDDDPICVLKHGDPVEELIGDREQEDVGVKFTAWATTTDRLYTGSSDGVVKVWNIRHGKGVLVRDLIEVAAPITAGAFSPDFNKLLIGDGSGRVYLMDVDSDKEDGQPQNQNNPASVSSAFFNLQFGGQQRAIRRPRPFIPHPTPPPPDSAGGHEDLESEAQVGQQLAKKYLHKSQLVLHPNPTIGAVQGPRYVETNLFRAEAHLDGNTEAPLLATFEAQQRANHAFSRKTRFAKQRGENLVIGDGARYAHSRNLSRDGEGRLDGLTRRVLEREGAEVEVDWRDLDYEDD